MRIKTFWLYEIGQIDARNVYDFALMQGVEAEGISRMFMAGRDDMWRPTPEELMEYGIVGRPSIQEGQ